MDSTILFLLAISIFSTATARQGNTSTSNIILGSSLTPTNISYWSSGSGLFAFGFYQEGNGYAVGIWLSPKNQTTTVLWTAKRDDPRLPSDVTLNLTSNGRLILQYREGQQEILANTVRPAASASMLDSGNFVLYDSDSMIIWQTFRFPTDTILPGQALIAGDRLVSRKSETDHASGKFLLIMQNDGNLVQYPSGFPPSPNVAYWNSGTYKAGNTTSLNLLSNGWLYLKNSTGVLRTLSEGRNESEKAFYHATLDANGIFRLYSRNLDDQSENRLAEWWPIIGKCDPLGLCGLNSYCELVGENQEPSCTCFPGFDFIDEGRKDLGCNRTSSAVDCSSTDTMLELENVQWEESAYFNSSTASAIQCRDDCLRDCDCEAALYRFSNRQCKRQRLPLRFGRARIGQNNQMTSFIKVKNEGLGDRKGKKKIQTGILVTGIVLSTAACFLLLVFGVLVYRYRIWQYNKVSSQGNVDLFEDVTLRSFSYDELKNATNNFMDEIGKGAFGTVFRGVTSNGNKIVAIKRLEKVVAEGDREFQNEMKVIGRTHHKNLVQLLGYCHEGTNRLLVYEYMSNGLLADFLFKSETMPAWEERLQIILNVARGLFYLHEECATQIIHCDIKPENILMDEKGCAKIADFGLSKLLMPDQSKTYNTGLRGTRGYVAPEWHRNLPINVRADVYSFGIMLLEIICCRRSVDYNVPEEEVVLEYWVYDCFKANKLNDLVRNEEVEGSQIERVVRVGLCCIQDDPSSRPSMKKVVLMLEGTVDIPNPPCPPSYSSSI